MRTDRKFALGYRTLKGIEFIAVFGLAASGALHAIKPDKPPPWFPDNIPVAKIQAFDVVVAPLLGAVLVITKFVRSGIGHPVTWEQVQAIVDQLQDDLFGSDGAPRHHNQITIMRRRSLCIRGSPWRRRWYWPWGPGGHPFSGWLVPVARSGHGKKKCKTVFLAPDDMDQTEGIAGATWALGKTGKLLDPVENLPQLCEKSTPEERNDYAARGYVDERWVNWCIRTKRFAARSYAGIPIEVENKMWGVLVIDSRSPTLPSKAKMEHATRTAAKLLSVVLKGT